MHLSHPLVELFAQLYIIHWHVLHTVDLRYVATTLHTDADVHIGEPLLAQKQQRLSNLEAH